jgi:iron(III) transport system permease protein
MLPPLLAALTPSGLVGAPPLGWREVWLLLRSLLLAGLTTLVSLMVGLPCAWLLAHRDVWGRSVFKTLLLVPFLLPPYMSAIAWLRLVDLPGNVVTTSLMLGFCYFPVILYPTLLALERLGGGLEEAGWLSLGVRATWRRVVWPLVAPFALGGAALVWMLTLVEYGVPSLLGLDSYALEIFALIQGYHDYVAAGRASLPLLAGAILPGILVLRWGFPRMRRLTIPQTGRPACRQIESKVGPFLFLSLVALLSVVLPVVGLLGQARRRVTFELALWEAGGDLLTSLQIAGCAAVLALLLGVLVGMMGGTHWAGLTLLTLAVPPSLVGLGLLAASAKSGMNAGNLLLVWGLASRFVALPACLMALSKEAVPPSHLDAARLTLSPWRARFLCWFGLHRRTWQIGFCLTFALCMGDLSLSLLLAEPGTSTLALRIFNLYHYGRSDLVSALCLVLMGVVLTPMAVFTCLEKRLP